MTAQALVKLQKGSAEVATWEQCDNSTCGPAMGNFGGKLACWSVFRLLLIASVILYRSEQPIGRCELVLSFALHMLLLRRVEGDRGTLNWQLQAAMGVHVVCTPANSTETCILCIMAASSQQWVCGMLPQISQFSVLDWWQRPEQKQNQQVIQLASHCVQGCQVQRSCW
jgi:hypothetical protein